MTDKLNWKTLNQAVHIEQDKRTRAWIPSIYRPRYGHTYSMLNDMNQTVHMLRQALPTQYDAIEHDFGLLIDRSFDPFNPIGKDENDNYPARFQRLITAVHNANNEDRFK